MMNDTPGRMILVLADDDYRADCRRWLERKGYHVIDVTRGSDALILCARHTFDVVVMDMDLPESSGIDVLQSMRQSQPGLEALILTHNGLACFGEGRRTI